jgi:serine phosphatase RsbU (regulator of sigma subunit)
LISGETGEAQVLHSPAGTLLGYLSDTPFGTMLVHVKKGDKFLLFSDALFEDGDPEKCISIEDVADLAASLLATGGSADFPARLVRRLKGDTPLHDDLSLIFVEFEGSAS